MAFNLRSGYLDGNKQDIYTATANEICTNLVIAKVVPDEITINIWHEPSGEDEKLITSVYLLDNASSVISELRGFAFLSGDVLRVQSFPDISERSAGLFLSTYDPLSASPTSTIFPDDYDGGGGT